MNNLTFKRSPTPDMLYWLLNGHTGTSSMTLLAIYLGIPKVYLGSPGDEHDIGRCMNLVGFCPEIRECFPEIAPTHSEWRIVTEHWDELCRINSESGPRAMGDRFRELRIPLLKR